MGVRKESNMFNSAHQKTPKTNQGERKEQTVFKSTRKNIKESENIPQ
jgi:hypothetical protein